MTHALIKFFLALAIFGALATTYCTIRACQAPKGGKPK